MWRELYNLFTLYEGIYIFYAIPIAYFSVIILKVIMVRRIFPNRFGSKDILSAVIILILSADFINYLYLFSTQTGRLLPLPSLLVKYTVGAFLWLWVFRYSYEGYFARRAAGERFQRRRAGCVLVGSGCVTLAAVGMLVS